MVNFWSIRREDKVPIQFGELKNDSFEFEQIEDYFQKRSKADAFHLLSYKTCNDLDFNALFMFLDRTNSRVGQQFLYSKLRSISNDRSAIPQHEAIISRIAEDETFRSTILGLLSRLKSIQAFYPTSLMFDEHLKPPRWFFVVRILSLLSFLVLILCFVNPVFILSAFGILAINIGLHYWNKRNLYQYVGSLPQLLRLCKVARE